jgi:hypothetical protein
LKVVPFNIITGLLNKNFSSFKKFFFDSDREEFFKGGRVWASITIDILVPS